MNAEVAKAIVEFYTSSMENEAKTTAAVLAAVPDSGHGYKPDPKSRTAWELATHIASSDVWFLDSIIAGNFGFDPAAENRVVSQFKNTADVVAYYDREYPARLAKLRAMPAEDLLKVVGFFGVMQAPNITYLGIANNHGIHHRGQLAAYLRAMGSKVPNIYGPSADAEPAGA
jgi:uncharacterized damage-inducible protein DinB